MNKNLLIFIILFFMCSISVNAVNYCVGATQNFSCGSSLSEDCVMSGDMTIDSANCFYDPSNVVIDCNGYTITVTTSGMGIVSDNGGTSTDIARNCNIVSDGYGIYLSGADYRNIVNTNVTASYRALELVSDAKFIIVNNSIFNGNIYIDTASNLFTNSVLNGTVSIDVNGLDNTFLHNIFISDVWLDNNGTGSIFNDSNSGNTYYFANNTPSWLVYDITTTTPPNYADSGIDRPFGATNTPTNWLGNGEDNFPYTNNSHSCTFCTETCAPCGYGCTSTNLINMYNGYDFIIDVSGVGDITGWNTSCITDMQGLFSQSNFNQAIGNWDMSTVTNIDSMFYITLFNQDISLWNTTSITNMKQLFYNDNVFNQNISSWDTSSVITMESMFATTTSFNQDISFWNISNVGTMFNMFYGGNITVSNYDKLLNAWASQSVQNGVIFDVGVSQYSSVGLSSRNNTLIGVYNWTISDGGMIPTPIIPTGNVFKDVDVSPLIQVLISVMVIVLLATLLFSFFSDIEIIKKYQGYIAIVVTILIVILIIVYFIAIRQ